jgi:hypothetical protein
VVISLAVICFLLATADDKTTCEKKCEQKYDEKNEKACSQGCSLRGPVASGGWLSFVKCHRGCDGAYTNATTENEACHYACSLPMSSSVFMSRVDDNGVSRWKVVRKEGDGEPVTTYEDESPLGSLLGKPQMDKALNLKSPFSSEESDEDMDEILRVQSQMQKLLENVHREFEEKVRAGFEENLARERPNGHDPWGHQTVIVGNVNDEGEPIMSVHPIDEEPPKAILLEFRRHENKSRMMVLFHWVMVVTGILALLTTILAIGLFLRSLRNNRYRRMGRDGFSTMPVFARVQPVSPLPVKKIPEEGWIEQTKPSGIAPPAYDQVSIHATPKMADSDQSTDEAETPSPTH